MARRKLKKFADISSYPNVYENFHPMIPELYGQNRELVDLKGRWAKQHFKNNNPITLELACGRGEYTLQLAREYPERNFIGVDIKGARIHQGATIALEEGLKNVAFLRMKIEKITNFFAHGEVDKIWITFPDPFLKDSRINRRLTSPRFLRSYQELLLEGGTVNLKTDSTELYEYSLELVQSLPAIDVEYFNDDIYAKELDNSDLRYKTYYEKKHLANDKTIKYLRFKIRPNVFIPVKDEEE